MERTLAIVKPDCVKADKIGKVISRIEKAGFRILGLKMIHLSAATAGEFYAVHRERPFYQDLIAFMTSGPCVVIALEKENAISDYRKLIGATDPAEADPGTIRADLAQSKQDNCVHGSDSVENGKIEVGFFFAEQELVTNQGEG